MASITDRGSSYQVEIRRKDSPKVSKCFRSLSDAKAWARQVEADMDRGNSPIARVRGSVTPTLVQALDRYLREVVVHKKSALQERSFIKQWQRGRYADKTLAAITSQDLARYRDEALAMGKAPATVVRHLALLSHVFTVATREWGFNLDNPVLKIKKPRVANARARRPTAQELAAVLAQIKSKEIRVFIQLAAETAMRRSELRGLSWDRVDLQSQLVYLADTKNGDSRTVVISSKAVKLFQSLPSSDAGAVFTFTHKDTPTKAFIRAVKAARADYEVECRERDEQPRRDHLQDLRLHDMRHEATSSLFEKGLAAIEVASITGHKSLAMLSRYTHLAHSHLVARLG
jgi:integrase